MPQHAVVARQTVHDGLVKRVPHVQGAGDVGRWQLNGKVMPSFGGLGAGLPLSLRARLVQAKTLPVSLPWGLDGGGVE